MAELIATNPLDALLPVTRGGVALRAVDAGAITSLAPYRGQEGALSAALETAHGMAFPAPNRATGGDGARCVWTGAAQAMLLGPVPEESLARHAALTDQSDGWVVVRLDGAAVAAVLARLVPLDLGAAHFKPGHAARTLLQHMGVSLLRLGPEAFQIMAFRSMAGTLVHDLTTAMTHVAARGDLGRSPG